MWSALAAPLWLACGGGTYDGDGIDPNPDAQRPDGPKPAALQSEIALSTDEDVAVELTLPFENTDPSRMVFRATAAQLGAVRFENGVAWYRPAPHKFGEDSFELIAANANGEARVPVRVSVRPINDAPLVGSDSYTVKRGESVTIELRSLDVEEQPLSVRIVAAPQHGTLTGDGMSRVYTPEPTYRGNDSFRFVVNDGELDSAVATISIRVTGVVVCGDGIVDTGEACDDGNEVDTDACRNDCSVPACGDGVLDAGEACDDGNVVDGDGCSPTCELVP